MSNCQPYDLAAIVITPEDYEHVREVIAHLRAQTVRERIELVLVAPAAARLQADEAELSELGGVQVVELGAINNMAQAYAAGMRAARAPVVALCEDHSFPAPDWAEKLLAAHAGPWAVVGPAVRNGNPDSLVSWADFFIGYSAWADPAPPGPRRHLPGHNSSYKREVLLDYGDALPAWLEAESALHWHLRSQGRQLFLESSARTAHLNVAQWRPWLAMNVQAGRRFAGYRASSWPLWRRLLYAAASPLIPLVRLTRLLPEVRRPGRYDGSLAALLPVLALGLALDGLGQMVGYALGPGDSSQRLIDIDLHRHLYL